MSQVELFLQAKHRLGEAIIWHDAHQCLYWIDLLDPALFCHDLKTANTQSWPLALEAPIGAITATDNPDLLLITHRQGLSLLRIAHLSLEPYCDPEAGRDAIIWNDAKCDRWGRLWAGTSHFLEKEARGALWCIQDRRRFALGDVGFAISNGPAVSPDGGTLYFNDSVGRTTYAYDITEKDLHPRNRRALIHFSPEEGLPDGIIVDAEGCLWIAHWGGARVSRHTPGGKLVATYPLPAQNATTMCFAGPDLTTLYITTASDGLDADALAEMPLSGSLFRLQTGVKGLLEPLFQLGSRA
jgi:xylono-1,5-lactonase